MSAQRIRLPGTWPATGAAYLAWCAYPNESTKRDRFARYAIAGLGKAHDVRLRDTPTTLRGKRDEKIVNTVNRGLERITKRRFPAAYLAWWELDGGVENPRGQFTTRESARKSLADTLGAGYSDDDNFRQRVVRETRPALALALALLQATAEGEREVLDVIRDESLCTDCIARARQLAPALRDVFGAGILAP